MKADFPVIGGGSVIEIFTFGIGRKHVPLIALSEIHEHLQSVRDSGGTISFAPSREQKGQRFIMMLSFAAEKPEWCAIQFSISKELAGSVRNALEIFLPGCEFDERAHCMLPEEVNINLLVRATVDDLAGLATHLFTLPEINTETRIWMHLPK